MTESVWDYPPADVAPGCIQPAGRRSSCEWKGIATYFDVVGGERREARAAWGYPDPVAACTALRDHVALYAGRMDAGW